MGRRNVYLPDDLDNRAKKAKLSLSRILQRAVEAELEAMPKKTNAKKTTGKRVSKRPATLSA